MTPSHTAFRIPQEYLNEAPWPFAQQQISYISAYRTPREKLQTVIRWVLFFYVSSFLLIEIPAKMLNNLLYQHFFLIFL